MQHRTILTRSHTWFPHLKDAVLKEFEPLFFNWFLASNGYLFITHAPFALSYIDLFVHWLECFNVAQTISINNDKVDHVISEFNFNLLLLNLCWKLTQINININFLICICMRILLNEFLSCWWVKSLWNSFGYGCSYLLCWFFLVVFWNWKGFITRDQALCRILLWIFSINILLLIRSLLLWVISCFHRIFISILRRIWFWSCDDLTDINVIRLITVWLNASFW